MKHINHSTNYRQVNASLQSTTAVRRARIKTKPQNPEKGTSDPQAVAEVADIVGDSHVYAIIFRGQVKMISHSMTDCVTYRDTMLRHHETDIKLVSGSFLPDFIFHNPRVR